MEVAWELCRIVGKAARGILAACWLAMWCLALPAVNLAEESNRIVLADFETGADGFPSLWLQSDREEHKVGAAAGRIRIGPLPLRFKSQRTPGTALVFKSLAGVPEFNREFKALHFWAKSRDISSFRVQLLDGWVQAHQFDMKLNPDGNWHELEIKLDQAWHSPVTEISFEVTKQEPVKEEAFVWIDHITATVEAALPPPLPTPTATRLLDKPLFQPKGGRKGDDTRAYFPTLVKIPEWIPASRRPDPSAKYYLYWAVHKGGYYIRMSWASELTGTYTEWNPGKGVLRNIDVGLPAGEGDFASPDVHVLPDPKKFRMFVHSGSTTYVAESEDGMHWSGVKEKTGEYVKNDNYYYRVWKHNNDWYAINRGGNLMRSTDGLHFEERLKRLWWPAAPAPRHVGVCPHPSNPDILDVFVSRVPVQDEHIELTRLDMSATDPRQWHQILGYVSVLKPEKGWEGATLPPSISVGSSEPPVRQLRDPYVYIEDGRYYLIYTIKGEQGFGIAELPYAEAPK